MAGNVKEEHYKVVYATGGMVKPMGDEQEISKNNASKNPSPGSMYMKGGETEEYQEGGQIDDDDRVKESDVRLKEVSRVKESDVKLKEPKERQKLNEYEPQILAKTRDGKALSTSKEAYREAKVISEDEQGVTVQIPKSLIPFIPMSVGLNYSDYNKYGFGQLLNKSKVEGMHVPSQLFDEEGTKDTSYVTANPLKHKLTKGRPIPPPKKDEEEMLKKRLGGGIGYSYKNQQYETPKGDNISTSNRKSQGESFSDKITGMGE